MIGRININMSYIEEYWKIFRKYKCNKILDAGCGTNRFKEYAKDEEAIGMDLNSSKADMVSDVQKLPFKDNTFDGVLCLHVLEHLLYPLIAVKEFHRVLRQGGILICVCPTPWVINAWNDPYHVRPHTKRSLETLAEDGGFIYLDSYYNVGGIGFGILRLYKLRFLSFLPFLRDSAVAVCQKRVKGEV